MASYIKIMFLSCLIFGTLVFFVDEIYNLLRIPNYVHTGLYVNNKDIRNNVLGNRKTVSQSIKDSFYRHFKLEFENYSNKNNLYREENKSPSTTEIWFSGDFKETYVLNMQSDDYLIKTTKMGISLNQKNKKTADTTENFDNKISTYKISTYNLYKSLKSIILFPEVDFMNQKWEPQFKDRFNGRILAYFFSDKFLVIQTRIGFIKRDKVDYKYFLRLYKRIGKGKLAFMTKLNLNVKEKFNSFTVKGNVIYYTLLDDIFAFRTILIKEKNGTFYLQEGENGPKILFEPIFKLQNTILSNTKSYSANRVHNIYLISDQSRYFIKIDYAAQRPNLKWDVKNVLNIVFNKNFSFKSSHQFSLRDSIIENSLNSKYFVFLVESRIFVLSTESFDDERIPGSSIGDDYYIYNKIAISDDGKIVVLLSQQESLVKIMRKIEGKSVYENRRNFVLPEKLFGQEINKIEITSAWQTGRINNGFVHQSDYNAYELLVLFKNGEIGLVSLNYDDDDIVTANLHFIKNFQKWNIIIVSFLLTAYYTFRTSFWLFSRTIRIGGLRNRLSDRFLRTVQRQNADQNLNEIGNGDENGNVEIVNDEENDNVEIGNGDENGNVEIRNDEENDNVEIRNDEELVIDEIDSDENFERDEMAEDRNSD